MPRTHNNLFGQIIEFDNLFHAYREARRGKRYRAEVMRYAAHAEEHLINLQNHLIWGSWQPGRPRSFTVLEPKRRDIQAPPFTDRVLHHALAQVVGPLFERTFITDSFACRSGKGTQAAVNRAQHFLRRARRQWGDGVYVIKADVSKFFQSIRHDVLMTEITRVVSDPRVLDLWRRILAGYGHDDGVGLPVGALTSQLGANIILNRLDHVAKDNMGLRYYLRYMDDFVVIVPGRAQARSVLAALTEQVNALGLSLNPKTAYHPWQRGLDYCGYRIWPTHILPRKRNIKRAKLQFRTLSQRYLAGRVDLEHIRVRVASFLAYTKHCSARRTVEGVLGDLVLKQSSNVGTLPPRNNRQEKRWTGQQ